jgi:hypothetical protein
MDEATARTHCQTFLDATEVESAALLDVGTVQTKRFWLFRWNSREAVETNGARGYKKTPWVAVEKTTGKVHLGDEPPSATWPRGLNPATLLGAEWIAQAHLESVRMPLSCSIMPELTQERPAGWLFFWNSDAFIRSRSIDHSLVGNGPLFILKATGAVVRLGTATSAEEQLSKMVSENLIQRQS